MAPSPVSSNVVVLRAGIVKRIHVNQHVIKANRRDGTKHPVVTVKTSKGNHYGVKVVIRGPSSVVYAPAEGCNPLECGAVVWIVTRAEVVIS